MTEIDLESAEPNRSELELGDGDKSNKNGRSELVEKESAAVQEDLIPGINNPVEKPTAVSEVENFTTSKRTIVGNNFTAQC